MALISKDLQRKVLLNPGPATTTDRVKAAQLMPDICPREKEFGQLVETIRRDLTRIAGGDDRYTTIPFCCSGTGAVEAAITSAVPPDRSILIIDNGAYGKRMIQIAQAFSIPVVPLRYPYGDLPVIDDVAAALKTDRRISHVAFVHHETTTGILNPIADLCAVAKKYGAETIVDSMSGFAGIPLSVLDDGIDFLLASSNKNIQGMAGIGLVICRLAALEKTKPYPRRNFYFNLWQQYASLQNTGQFAFTPPVQVLYALREAIDEFFDQGGVDARHRRYADNWQVLTDGLRQMGFQLVLPDRLQSKILTAILEPADPNYDFDAMHDYLYERGFTIYPGKGAAKGDTFRLANMGAVDAQDMRDFLKTLQDALRHMGVKNLAPKSS